MKVKGALVVITGAGSGMGRAMTLELIRRGAKVAALDLRHETLEETRLLAKADLSQLETFVVDVTSKEAVSELPARIRSALGEPDILINNAGVSMRALVQDVSIETLKKVMDINFWGTVYCTKAALEGIVKNQGIIVGVSSIAGYRGLPGRSGYSASKYALHGWLEALRTELVMQNTHVMWVCPGFTASNIRNAALNKDAKAQGESPMDEGAMMSSEACAGHIIDAMKQKKRTLVLTFTGKRTVFMNKFFPAWADKLAYQFFFKNGELIK